MKVNNDAIMMNTHRPTIVSGNIVSKLSLEKKTDKVKQDRLDISISGRARAINSTEPIRKVRTAGLIITDLKISRPNGQEYPKSFEIFTATVSNERAALGTSENRLGGNTRSIDNPPENEFRENKWLDYKV